MDAIANLIITLLHAGTAAHVLHLQAKGAGSYARHSALGEFYGEIIDRADALAEAYQGAGRAIIAPYPDGYVNPGQDGTQQDALEFLQALGEFVATTRKDVLQSSQIQNLIDEVAELIDSTIYKIENLQ